jgi:hypothetical protein
MSDDFLSFKESFNCLFSWFNPKIRFSKYGTRFVAMLVLNADLNSVGMFVNRLFDELF